MDTRYGCPVSTIGLLHPGEMGAAIGAALRSAGHEVLWASDGRSAATVERAQAAGLTDLGTIDALAQRAEVVISVVPPHAAADMVGRFAGYGGLYIDANAISPETARTIAFGPRFVDGGIVGPPPQRAGTTRLYLSGPEAEAAAELFSGTNVDAPVVSAEIGAASAVKMAYAAWTKGTAALLLNVRALARAEGVESTLLAEWQLSQPQLKASSDAAARSALGKGWRWEGEMDEIAATFAAAGLPDGFHRAAAEIYARSPHGDVGGDDPLDQVLGALLPVRDTALDPEAGESDRPVRRLFRRDPA